MREVVIFPGVTTATAEPQEDAAVAMDLAPVGQLREARGEGTGRRIVLDLIVEGFGNKADNHFYSADLLERTAPLFEGAQMYSDHLTQEAERKLGGLPRSWREIVGRITRTWLDRNEQGKRVVRGEAEVFDDQLWQLLGQALDVIGVSINARGTAKEGMVEGRRARMVESITKVKSVDVVAEAGAGGRILALVEAALDERQEDMVPTEDAEVREADEVVAEEPVEEADAREEGDAHVEEGDAEDWDAEADEDEDEDEDEPRRSTSRQREADAEEDEDTREAGVETGHRSTPQPKRRSDRDPLTKFAGRPGRAKWGPEWHPDADLDELELTGEDADPRGRRVRRDTTPILEGDALEAQIEQRARAIAAERLAEAVGAAITEVRSELEGLADDRLAEQAADFERELAQRDQRHAAAGLIEASGLPLASQRALKEQFFDSYHEADDDRDADTVLRESVHEAVTARARELGEWAGARVSGLGATHDPSRLQESRRASTPPAGRDRGGLSASLDAELGI